MIQCPRCSKTLPDSMTQCQFCGADTRAVPRPKPAPGRRQDNYGQPQTWIVFLYYGIAIYWILGGAFSVLSGSGATGQDPTFTMVAFGAFKALLGIGLVLKLEVIRGIVNILCWLTIAVGLIGFFTILAFGGLVGPIVILFAILQLIDVVAAGTMIFLIGETDRAANI